MSNLSKRCREVLSAEMTFLSGTTVADRLASDGTHKLLIQWADADPAGPASADVGQAGGGGHAEEGADGQGQSVRVALPMLGAASAEGSAIAPDTSRQTECVMIPSESDAGPRRTACISSQVGCPVGCKFCASGLGGLDGNLSTGRIVEQVWRLGELPDVRRISNVVFMGMGEPLSNFQNVVGAIRIMNGLWGLGISARKITISTVGLPAAIEKLARELELPVTLALSLHAPTDEIRRQLIPWANYTTIKDLLAACDFYFRTTGREITLEYTLLRDVNDRPQHAHELARLARTLRANVNLIRYNEVAGIAFNRPKTDDVRGFQEILRQYSINAHIRASRGRDIAAACGQLRHESAGR
jgi:23S rRNA (adenine2503-C2)-methyltransferase